MSCTPRCFIQVPGYCGCLGCRLRATNVVSDALCLTGKTTIMCLAVAAQSAHLPSLSLHTLRNFVPLVETTATRNLRTQALGHDGQSFFSTLQPLSRISSTSDPTFFFPSAMARAARFLPQHSPASHTSFQAHPTAPFPVSLAFFPFGPNTVQNQFELTGPIEDRPR